MTIPDSWHDIKKWCLGENDRWGSCWFAGIGNWDILHGGIPMPDVEIESAARAMEGWSSRDPSTDHGMNMEAGFTRLVAEGWPGNPMLRPMSWSRTNDFAATIRDHRCALAWCMLPRGPAGDWDLTNQAVRTEAEPEGGHAILLVQATPEWITMITWGEPRIVSVGWWSIYGRDCYDLRHP